MEKPMRKLLYRLHSLLVSKAVTRALELTHRALPPVVHVETTNACNANCIMCPRSKMTRRIGFMDEELYQGIIEECAPNKIVLHLHNFGEPLLDRRLAGRIELAKEAGISRVKIFTNGSLLTEKKSEELIQSGLDEIKISIDGGTKNTFEGIRRNLDYDVVCRNIRCLLDLKRRLGTSNPRIKLVYTTVGSNELEVEEFRREWENKVDKLHVDVAHNWAEASSSAEYPQARGFDVRHPCLRIWNTFTILWNGDVALCCLDYDGRVIIGNLKNQTIKEIWQSRQLRQIRKMHTARKFQKLAICRDCSKTMYFS